MRLQLVHQLRHDGHFDARSMSCTIATDCPFLHWIRLFYDCVSIRLYTPNKTQDPCFFFVLSFFKNNIEWLDTLAVALRPFPRQCIIVWLFVYNKKTRKKEKRQKNNNLNSQSPAIVSMNRIYIIYRACTIVVNCLRCLIIVLNEVKNYPIQTPRKKKRLLNSPLQLLRFPGFFW